MTIWTNRGNTETEITKELFELRRNEPPHSHLKDCLRACIMGYELKAIQQYTSRKYFLHHNEATTPRVVIGCILGELIGDIQQWLVKSTQSNLPLEIKRELSKTATYSTRDLIRFIKDGIPGIPYHKNVIVSFKASETVVNAMEHEAKLGMADLITQCRMLCLDCNWDFDELQILGLEHLKERHEDFKKDGFSETGSKHEIK